MANYVKLAADLLRLHHESYHPESLPYTAVQLHGDAIDQARRLQADVYVARGIVTPNQIDKQGMINEKVDPYVHNSLYYGSFDKKGRLAVAARLITAKNDISDLQIDLSLVDPYWARKLQGQRPREVAEFSAFVKAPNVPSTAVVDLLVTMYWDSLMGKGIKYWLFELHPGPAKHFDFLFGPALREMGNPVKVGKFQSMYYPKIMDLLEVPDRLHQPRSELGPIQSKIAELCARAILRNIAYRRKQMAKLMALGRSIMAFPPATKDIP